MTRKFGAVRGIALASAAIAGLVGAGLSSVHTALAADPATETATCADPHVDTPASALSQGAAEAAVLCLANAAREYHALPDLVLDAQLATAARGHAQDAVDIKWWGAGADPHTNPVTGTAPQDRIVGAGYCPAPIAWSVGENTFWGYEYGASAVYSTPRAAVTFWLTSPGHRANTLSPTFTALGVGVVGGTADNVGSPDSAGTFVEDFGGCQN